MLFLFGGASAAQILVFAVAKLSNSTKLSGTVIGFVNMVEVASGLFLHPIVGYLLSQQSSSHGSSVVIDPVVFKEHFGSFL